MKEEEKKQAPKLAVKVVLPAGTSEIRAFRRNGRSLPAPDVILSASFRIQPLFYAWRNDLWQYVEVIGEDVEKLKRLDRQGIQVAAKKFTIQ